MDVRMKVSISGTRNGVDWPPIGSTVSLPDTEAADMVSAGLAAPVEIETATAVGRVETAAKKSPRRR